jgi:hypothetical protein
MDDKERVFFDKLWGIIYYWIVGDSFLGGRIYKKWRMMFNNSNIWWYWI